MKRHSGESAMTVMGALSSFRGLGEMSPYKRASRRNDCAGTNLALTGARVGNDEEWKARGCAASSSRPVTVQLSENLSWRFPDTHMIEKILRTDPNYTLTFLRIIAGLIIFHTECRNSSDGFGDRESTAL
jgi:hypothetical protein